MPEKVKIPIAVFEYTVEFTRPIISLWMDRAVVVQAMFDALIRWNLDINEVEAVTTGKPSEQGVKIRLSSKYCTIFFGPASFKFQKDNADWASAEETIEILDAALGTLIRASGAELVDQKTAFALHLQPTTKTFLEVIRPFLSPALEALRTTKLKTGASIVKWEDGRVVLDGSASLANGVYLRLERDFNVKATFAEMAKELRTGEEALFKLLDIEEDIG
jgi:hypothetical protein